jgi:hypothetical protein
MARKRVLNIGLGHSQPVGQTLLKLLTEGFDVEFVKFIQLLAGEDVADDTKDEMRNFFSLKATFSLRALRPPFPSEV